ncbi:MAG TPA: spore coat protein CotH [Clostridiaceae bacterium]|nr:spore coat protein CotH [Clostridiaceae bacterium]
MKYKIIMVALVLLIVSASIALYYVDEGRFEERFHQHLSYPSEKEFRYRTAGFQTHLPVFSIDTNDQRIPGTPIPGQDLVYELAEDGTTDILADMSVVYDHLDENKTFIARVRYRGNSSRYFSKKSYAIRIVNKEREEVRKALLGMEAHDEWALHGPYLDRTLIRNYMAMNLAGEMMPYAPEVRFVELFQDGKYQGVYVLMETISKGEGRVEIDTPLRNSALTSYLVEMDRAPKMDPNSKLTEFLTKTYRTEGRDIDLVYPGQGQFTLDRKDYVEKDLTKIAKSLYLRPLEERYEGFSKTLNVQAFQDYFILNELFRNVDAGFYSTFWYKDTRGLLTPVVWDFNNALDNYQEISHSVAGFSLTGAVFFDTLLKDPQFVEGLLRRYSVLRRSILSEERLMAYITETEAYLGTAVTRNYAVWGSVFSMSNYYPEGYLLRLTRNVESYEEAVETMAEFLRMRGRWLDEHMHTLRQYSHPSRNSFEITR